MKNLLKFGMNLNFINYFRKFYSKLIVWILINQKRFSRLFFYYPIFYRDFIKDALKVTLDYLCDELDLEVRTGALYSLYGIYFHQIDCPKVKVRNFLQV
jgi:hypothetical protein